MQNDNTNSKQKEINFRHQYIINRLLQGDVSKEQLAQQMQVTPYTLKHDLNYLRKIMGYEIESHKGILTLKNREHSCLQHEKIGYNEVQQFSLLHVLNKEPKTFKQISEAMYNNSAYSLRKNIINVLREQHLVTYNEKDHTYCNTSRLLFFSLSNDANQIYKFALYCLSLHDMPVQLYNYAISRLTNIEEDPNIFFKNEIVHAKRNSALHQLPFYISKLQDLDSQDYALTFDYSSSTDKTVHITFFYVGFTIYSRDRDIVYLVGRNRPSKQSYAIYRADRIHWDTLQKANNENFTNNLIDNTSFKENLQTEFENIKAEMFDISSDKPEDVQIKLEYTSDIASEIERIVRSRERTANINYETDLGNIYCSSSDVPQGENIKYILYYDRIRGLSSFSNYIRKFGDKLTVLSNENLKQQLLESANRTLDNYKERIITDYER